jgi:hypothetical protein
MAIFAIFALSLPPVLARTAATRALAASNTFSHDSYAIGIPDSASHSHKGSSPSSPSVNSRIRSSGPIPPRGASAARPRSSRQAILGRAPWLIRVTTSLPGTCS